MAAKAAKRAEPVRKIVYARGFPYGAPLAMVRGGATREPEVRELLREAGFRYDGARHAWTHYLYADDFREVLRKLAGTGAVVVPKEDMDPAYRLDVG